MAALTGIQPTMEASAATLSINYLRPATIESEMFVARARIGNTGRVYNLAQVVVEDAAGRGVARSAAAILTRPMDPPPAALVARWSRFPSPCRRLRIPPVGRSAARP
jgi:hypothetical protein